MSDAFLNKVYQARTADQTRALYDDWAEGYDAEIALNGYATPTRCAAALAGFADVAAPLLDFGCGTGLSGRAFAEQGFTLLDGLDLSDEMLAHARAKGHYRSLTRIDPGAPLPFAPGTHPAIAAVGVIGCGAAPAAVLDQLIDALPRGGHFVFSFNDHTLEDPSCLARMKARIGDGATRLIFEEYGPHLPGQNIKSKVYVLEKT
ncbi:class I SAM-dependent DNA methyltransferase [Chachezhania sediminis]|uniref:class I SAM-dependent DNA methyltransferase n=1 Tax=Chachezhania sediminis TaxID=2599291 RepID=UPI00131D1ED3|nr:methyltransferase domain-containing protein [Chachezhania sediminis]